MEESHTAEPKGRTTRVCVRRLGMYCGVGMDDSVLPNMDPANGTLGASGEPAHERAADAEETSAFFHSQNTIRDRLQRLTDASRDWVPARWLLFLGPPDSSILVSMHDRLEPQERFDYQSPVRTVELLIGEVRGHANEVQLAALMSLSAHMSAYTLRYRYGTARCMLNLPATGVPPRARWRAAATAVTLALQKGGRVSTGNMYRLLLDAKDYKTRYCELLVGSGLSAKEMISSVAVQQARQDRRVGEPLLEALQRHEDVLPVHTLAWCRLVARKHAIAILRKRGNASRAKSRTSWRASWRASWREGDDGMEEEEGLADDESEEIAKLEAVEAMPPAVDPRVEHAPEGYITCVVAVEIGRVELQLSRTLNDVERAKQRVGEASVPRGVDDIGLLHAAVSLSRARVRAIKGAGTQTCLGITSIAVHSGRAGSANHVDALPAAPILRMHGGIITDAMLGGRLTYPGRIQDFILARQQQNKSMLARGFTAVFGDVSAASVPSSPAPGGAAVCTDALLESADRKGSPEDGVVAEGEGAPESKPASAPAVLLTSLSPSSTASPKELWMRTAMWHLDYSPPFWIALDAFLRPMERAKWSSQLGATAMLRAKHSKIYRACDKLMKEAWHMPHLKIMTIFMELSDLLGLPSSQHKLDVCLGGFRCVLMSEKGTSTEELMLATLPPLRITKTPRVGEPLPPKHSMAIDFDGPIEVETTMEKNAFARVLMINTNGGPYQAFSRLHGTRDTLLGDVQKLHKEIAHLELETARLNRLRTAREAECLAAHLAHEHGLAPLESGRGGLPQESPNPARDSTIPARAGDVAVNVSPLQHSTIPGSTATILAEKLDHLSSLEGRMEKTLEKMFDQIKTRSSGSKTNVRKGLQRLLRSRKSETHARPVMVTSITSETRQ